MNCVHQHVQYRVGLHLRWNTLKNSCTYDTKYRRIGDIWYKCTRAKKEIYKIEYKLGGTNMSRLCPVSTARFHNMWISSSTNFKFIQFFLINMEMDQHQHTTSLNALTRSQFFLCVSSGILNLLKHIELANTESLVLQKRLFCKSVY